MKGNSIGTYVNSSFGKLVKNGKGVNRVIRGNRGLGVVGLAGAVAASAILKAHGDFTRDNDKYSKQTTKQADELIRVIKSKRKNK